MHRGRRAQQDAQFLSGAQAARPLAKTPQHVVQLGHAPGIALAHAWRRIDRPSLLYAQAQLDELAVRPHQRHRGAGGPTRLKIALRHRRRVPDLFRQQPAAAGHRRHGMHIRCDILAGEQRVVATLAGEQRPAATATGAVEGPAVAVLAVAIAVVAMPDRPVRRLRAQQPVHHLDGGGDVRVVGIAQAVAHQLQEIGRNLLVGGTVVVMRTVLDEQMLGLGAVAHQHRRRRGPQVIAGHAQFARQRGVARPAPVLDAGVPVVGDHQRQIGCPPLQEPRAIDQGGDDDGERERVDAGVLLPAVLPRAGPFGQNETQRSGHHVRHRHLAQRVAGLQHARKQHGERGLVELDTLPERLAAQPLVLQPVSVRLLRRDEIGQHVARGIVGAQRDQRTGGFDQVSRPHQVVAAAALAHLAPRHRQARHHGTRVGAILVDLEDAGRAPQQGQRLGANIAGVQLAPGAALAPFPPAVGIRLPRRLEAAEQTGPRQRIGRLAAAAEAHGERAAPRQARPQRHLTGTGLGIGPAHAAVAVEVLPQIAGADLAYRAPFQRRPPGRVAALQREREGPLLRPQRPAPIPFARPGDIAVRVFAQTGG